MELIVAKKRVKFKNLRTGLFVHDGILCLKSEYYSKSITTGLFISDAYVCETGEFWSGGCSRFLERDEVLVYPVKEIKI